MKTYREVDVQLHAFWMEVDSSASIVTGYGTDTTRVRFLAGIRDFFLYSIASTLALEPIQPPIQWVPAALSLGLKWHGREADHSPPSRAEVNNGGAIPPLPHEHCFD
jgi:hypothetical protein